MEDILHLYLQPHDEKFPVVCFDELPVQLLGEVVMPLPMRAGQPKRVDYEYARHGTCSLLVAFEPLTGTRLVEVSKQRTKADYCRFMQRVAALYPAAERIVLVQDNLNTHNASSFYENLPPAEAFYIGASVRDALHAEERLVAEHGGVRAIGALAHLLVATHLINQRA